MRSFFVISLSFLCSLSFVNLIWYHDSGAGLHVTSESLNIKQHQQFDGPDQIFIGNDASL